jgi:rRNA maturation protein Rpf1
MSIYITTSRKPSLLTRRLCRILSKLLPNSIQENRGKKSIDAVFERAKLLGKRRALLVYERNGNPSKILFMEIKGRSWNWLEHEFLISGIKLLKIPNEIPEEIKIEGENKILENLFDFETPESDEFITLKISRNELKFFNKGKEIGVKFKVELHGSEIES